MDEKVFTKDVTFHVKFPDLNNAGQWVTDSVTKSATFAELDTQAKPQHRLHFLITTLLSSQKKDEDEQKTQIDPDVMYDLTVKSIKTLLILNDKPEVGPVFTAQDKIDLLQDSSALLSFGLWLMEEKIIPFFPKLMPGKAK